MDMIELKDSTIDYSGWGIVKSLGYILMGGVTYVTTKLGITIEVLSLLGVAMLIYTWTGTWAAYRCGIKPTSDVGITGIMVKVMFLFLLGFTAVVLKSLGLDFTTLLKSVFTGLTVYEVYSIWGNFISIRTRKPVKEFDAVTAFIMAIREALMGIIHKMIDLVKNKKDE